MRGQYYLALGGWQEVSLARPHHTQHQVIREVSAADVIIIIIHDVIMILVIHTQAVTPHDEVILDVQPPDCQQGAQTQIVILLDTSYGPRSVPITLDLNKNIFSLKVQQTTTFWTDVMLTKDCKRISELPLIRLILPYELS